jgi:Mg2+ and Co2+ transporter CorA
MQKCLKINEYIKDLDSEIEELHRYVSLMEERERNRKISFLNAVAIIFLPITAITGFFGMNKLKDVFCNDEFLKTSLLVGGIILAIIIVIYNNRRKKS